MAIPESQGLAVLKYPLFQRFNKNRKFKTKEEVLNDNFEHILKKTNSDYIYTLLDLLMQDTDTQPIIKNNIDLILKRFDTPERKIDNTDYQIELLGSYKVDFIKHLRSTLGGSQLLEKYGEELLIKTQFKDLAGLARALNDISPELNEKIEEILQRRKLDFAKSLLCKRKTYDMENTKELIDNYSETLSIIIDELLQSEKVGLRNIKDIGTGSYSFVYQIGSKVLKVGKPRETYNIPNHPRILQPIARTNLLDKHNNPLACIEISDKVRTAFRSNRNNSR